MAKPRFTIDLELGTLAHQNARVLARALERIAKELREGNSVAHRAGVVRDDDGRAIGEWTLDAGQVSLFGGLT